MRSSLTISVLTWCAVAVVPVGTARGQKPAAPAKSWQVGSSFTTAAEYDDNVYLLSDARKTRLVSPSAPAPSRYANMEKASDVITKLRAELSFEGPGLGGRTLAVNPELGYDYYAVNADRRAIQFRVTADQNLPRGARARLRASVSPSTFFKNYLSDAIDADASGTITSSERVYSPGSYAEREVTAGYRHRLRKDTKAHPLAVFLDAGAGFYSRAYDAPFSRRNLSGPLASLGLAFDRDRMELGVGYDFAALGATPGRAVMLLDEPVYNRDFNGNGRTTDLDARAFEMVDHSRTEHGLSLSARVLASARTRVQLAYAHRRRSFGSTQPFDESNRGRTDARNELEVGTSVRLTPFLRLEAAFVTQSQSLNRAVDAALGEVADYTRRQTSVGMRYTP